MEKILVKFLLSIGVFVLFAAAGYFLMAEQEKGADEYELPILIYHHLSYDESKWGEATMSPDLFKKHMTALKSDGYTAISYKQLLNFTEGKGKLPVKPILITFDDGYRSNYEYAYPVLKELGMKAAISVIGWSVGETKYKDGSFDIIPHFSWKEAKEMVDSGVIEIEAHTYDMHELGEWISDRVGVKQMENESEASYRQALNEDFTKIYSLIKSNVGVAPLCLTYPYGLSTVISDEIVSIAGYKISVTTDKGINIIRKGSSLKKLNRFNIDAGCSEEKLLQIISQKGE